MGWPKGVPRKTATAPSAAPNGDNNMKSQTHTIPGTGVQIANAKVVSAATQTDALDGEGTTDKLFPDFQESTPDEVQKEEVKEEIQEVEKPPVESKLPEDQANENSQIEGQDEKQPEPIKQEDQSKYLDPEIYGDHTVVQVINGQRREVKFRDLHRISQTDQAVTQKAQKVAEERRQAAEEKRQLEILKQELLRQNPAKAEPAQNQFKSQAELDRIAQLEMQIQQLSQGLSPVIYQNNRQKLANELKNEGFDDFLDFIPKIEQAIGSVDDENLFNYYNTPEGAKSLYFQLKAKELKQSSQTVSQQPKKDPIMERQKPPIVKLDSGRSNSSGVMDDWKSKYNEALKVAQANPKNTEAWNRVLELKGYLK